MKVSFIVKTVTLLLVLIFTGCKESSHSSVTVYTLNNQQITKVEDEKQLGLILNNWEMRQEVKLKKQPVFDFKLTLQEAGQLSDWHYSSKGYVMSAKKVDDKIYRVDFSILDKIIQLNVSK